MVDFKKVGWTLAAVILLIICVQQASSRAVYTGRRAHSYQNEIVDHNHKHLRSLKSSDPATVEKVKKRIKERMKGRRMDQSNERNIWRSHPKNENWSGPDTQEVVPVIASVGI